MLFNEFRPSKSESDMPPITAAERRQVFEHYLRRAVEFGECTESSCDGMTQNNWAALKRAAGERNDASVAAAWAAYDDDIVESRELVAIQRAVRAGEIPRTPRPVIEYRPEMITMSDAQPDAARAWLEVNRSNPGEIYQTEVLDQPL